MSDNIKDMDFYRHLWRRLVGGEFTAQKLANTVRADGGIDIENLTESDVIDLIEGRFSASIREVAFSFSEMLAVYSVPGGIQTPQQIVGWVFAAFVIANVVRQGALDWELQFDNFMNGFLSIRDKFETEESIYIFQRVFGGDEAKFV